MNNILRKQQVHNLAREVSSQFFNRNFDERHNFRISEEMAPISLENIKSIEEIAFAMPDFIEGALKLEELSLIDDKLRRTSQTFRTIRRLLGVDGKFQQIIQLNKANGFTRDVERDHEQEILIAANCERSLNHPLIRLDCIVDADSGRVKIVEIEESKLHGLGYATLCRMLSDVKVGEGLVSQFVELTKDSPGLIVLANSEKFYEVEQRFFARKVNQDGGNLTVAMQESIEITEEGILVRDDFGRTQRIFTNIVNLPKFSGNSDQANRLEKAINTLFIKGVIKVRSFKREFLGEKTLLALISNPFNDPHLEELLSFCFRPQTLQTLREMLPSTFIPTNKQERLNMVEKIKSGEKFFVKVVNASGAKGVASFEEPERQIEFILQSNVIVQNAINSQLIELPFCDLASLETGVDFHTVRYGAFIVNGKLEEIAATASPSKIAHGGVRSIQTGIKII